LIGKSAALSRSTQRGGTRELPRLDNGKLYKRLLRDSYLQTD
jgi:hypothetical protein